MYLANMASSSPSRAGLGGLSLDVTLPPLMSFMAASLLGGSEPALSIGFDLAPAQGAASPSWPHAVPALAEPKDSFRPTAELAALLIYLRGGEAGFLPLPDGVSDHGSAEAPPPWISPPWISPPWASKGVPALMAALHVQPPDTAPVPPLPDPAAAGDDSGWLGFDAAFPPDPVWPLL